MGGLFKFIAVVVDWFMTGLLLRDRLNNQRRLYDYVAALPVLSVVDEQTRGDAIVSGVVLPRAELFETPLTATPAVFSSFVVVDRSRGRIAVSQRRSVAADLCLERGAISIPLEAHWLTTTLATDARAKAGLFEEPGADVDRVLAAYGVDTHGLVLPRKLRVTETHLAPGDVVTLIARFEQRGGALCAAPLPITEGIAVDGATRWHLRPAVALLTDGTPAEAVQHLALSIEAVKLDVVFHLLPPALLLWCAGAVAWWVR